MNDQAEKLRSLSKEVIPPAPRYNPARVISITSGKGGVGKTNLAINLAIQLRKHDKRVMVIDADFGLANVEMLFGITPRYCFGDLLYGTKTIDEVITEGPMGIKFISGGTGPSKLANVTDRHVYHFLENMSTLDNISDFVIVDTGAGISKTVVNFVKASNETIVVTTPEPTSITDAYTIIKTLREEKNSMPEFKIVVNRTDSLDEGEEVYSKLSKVSVKFLGIPLQYLGSIPYDPYLVKAVKAQEPVTMCFPSSTSARAIDKICLELLNIASSDGANRDGFKAFIKKLTNAFSN
ncbi:MAG: MinD/ParA family protein [Clostridiales bacterium]|jgi:flagellar biosynthesis protein FlhG|nr:MinD/ParA family protein [Clostridiales bacterium]